MPKAKKAANFEDALARLEKIVEQLESGEQSLENSLTLFEEGVTLTRSCQQSLASAEQKVQQLTSGPEGEQLEPFSTEQ